MRPAAGEGVAAAILPEDEEVAAFPVQRRKRQHGSPVRRRVNGDRPDYLLKIRSLFDRRRSRPPRTVFSRWLHVVVVVYTAAVVGSSHMSRSLAE